MQIDQLLCGRFLCFHFPIFSSVSEKIFKRLLILACIVFVIVSARTAVTYEGIVIGGYDVAKIASQSMDVLVSNGLLDDTESAELRSRIEKSTNEEPLIAAVPVVDAYEFISRRLIARGIASQDEVDEAKAAASKAGGTKVGGVNPVVLAASFLDLLARKGILPLPQAQSILDSSKKT